jgi:hypothetical protein
MVKNTHHIRIAIIIAGVIAGMILSCTPLNITSFVYTQPGDNELRFRMTVTPNIETIQVRIYEMDRMTFHTQWTVEPYNMHKLPDRIEATGIIDFPGRVEPISLLVILTDDRGNTKYFWQTLTPARYERQ